MTELKVGSQVRYLGTVPMQHGPHFFPSGVLGEVIGVAPRTRGGGLVAIVVWRNAGGREVTRTVWQNEEGSHWEAAPPEAKLVPPVECRLHPGNDLAHCDACDLDGEL